MTAISGTGDFGIEICEALGLGAHEIKEIHIHIVANDLVLVEVLKCMSPKEGKALTEILKKYELHEKTEAIKGFHLGDNINNEFINETDILLKNGTDKK